MKLIDPDGLNRFASLEASRRFLPHLVQRLLTAELGVAGVHVPRGVWRRGWDGHVVDAPGSAFVPRGASAWEFSNDARVASNATRNLAKRTANPEAIVPEQTTFVYVTMRHWQSKDRWVAKPASAGPWRDVRALDSEDLVAWMELCPDIHLWASQMIASCDRDDPAITSNLPPDVEGFVGREASLEQVAELLMAEGGCRTVVAWGAPGSGKTAFAVHAAHRIAEHFPAGQFFLDVRSAAGDESEGETRRTAARLIIDVLVRLGYEPDTLPGDLRDLVAVYRAALQDRPCLIVIDGAEIESQVRALDPGRSPSLLIVSSRSRLAGLESALRIEIKRLGGEDARRLLAHELGRPITRGEDASAERIVRLCDGLPLALRVVGRMAARHPQWDLAYLANRLGRERGRLGRLKVGDLAVRTSFAAAYRALSEDRRSQFRRACVIPGPAFTVQLLHATDPKEDVDEVADALDDLVDHGLMTPQARPGWYKVHDLLRLFGRECFTEAEEQGARGLVLRMLGDCLRVGLADSADALWPALAGVGRAMQAPGGVSAALGWLDEHFANLVAFAMEAQRAGGHNDAIDLVIRVFDYCEIRNRWADLGVLAHIVSTSIDAVQAKGTLHPEIGPIVKRIVLIARAKCAWGLRDFDGALALTDEAIAYASNAQDEAHVRLVRSQALRSLKRGGEALEDLRIARAAFAATDDKVSLEMAMHNTGALLSELGEPELALPFLERELESCVARGDLLGQAHTLNSIGLAHSRLAELEKAEAVLRRSAELALECGDLGRAGNALNDLGLVLLQSDDPVAAYQCHMQDFICCELLNDERGAHAAAIRAAHAMVFLDQVDSTEVLKLVEECVALALDRDDRELFARATAVKAEVAHAMSDFETADQAFAMAAQTFEEIDDIPGAVSARVWQAERALAADRAHTVLPLLRAMVESGFASGNPICAKQLEETLARASDAGCGAVRD